MAECTDSVGGVGEWFESVSFMWSSDSIQGSKGMFSSISGDMNRPVDVSAPSISPSGSKLGWQPLRVVL